MGRIKLIFVYSLLIVTGFAVGLTSCAWHSEKISKPFQYSGYSSPEYTSFTRSSEYLTMSDGIKLAVVKYLPSEGPSKGPYPVLFTYLPYHRENINPKTGEIKTYFERETVELFTSHGYAMVLADMRGTGASYGYHIMRSPRVVKDGKELADWIVAQPWCNGNFGMIGGAYHAWTQYATAGQKPKGLKFIVPQSTNFDFFSSGAYFPGGIQVKGNSKVKYNLRSILNRNLYIPDILFPATPVVDEDGDGELADEIPLDKNGDGSFLDDYQLPDNPPQYSDKKKRQHIYYHATSEHLSNKANLELPKGSFYRDAAGAGGLTPPDLNPSDFPTGIAESGIALFHIGGWFDVYARDTTHWYCTLKATNPSKMYIGPNNHSGLGLVRMKNGPYWEHFGEDPKALFTAFSTERFRFVEHYLKGKENGIDKEPPVYIYVMNGEGWRFENEWPLARQIMTKYFFDKGNTLTKTGVSEGTDTYHTDFTHDSRQESSLHNRYTLGNQDKADIRTDKDMKCLTYTSAPLENDTEITGHPLVRFLVSSTSDYGDFFVYLEDVNEKGDAYFVTDGMLRAEFAKLVPNEDILSPGAGIDVLPNLPWHGYRKSDYSDRIFAGGNIVELVFDLMPTSWVFKKGHHIRVSIACADWPTFALHPKLSPANNPDDPENIVPTITVYHTADYLSYIELPVIPKKLKR